MEFPSLTFIFRVKRNYDFSSIRQIWVYFSKEPEEQWKFHLLSEMEQNQTRYKQVSSEGTYVTMLKEQPSGFLKQWAQHKTHSLCP